MLISYIRNSNTNSYKNPKEKSPSPQDNEYYKAMIDAKAEFESAKKEAEEMMQEKQS